MIPFIDLKTQYRNIEDKIKSRVNAVLEHGQYIMGPEVKELESNLSEFVGCKHSIGCASGTDAIMIALLAIDLKPGDEVIVPNFTFFATAEIVTLLGGVPVFADVSEETYNIDVNHVEKLITNKTKAIMPVSLYGLTAELDSLMAIAEKNNLTVIEDAAQSFGAKTTNKMSCNIAHISCTSFYPAKPLGGYGDSGAIFTNDDALALKMRQILNHGQESGYHHIHIGINGRLDTIQAAILIEKLAIFPAELKSREEVAKRYTEAFQGKVKIQKITEGHTSAWAQYTIEVDNRDEFRAKLKELNVPTAVHYPSTITEQPIYKGTEADTPIATKVSKRVVSLPMSPYLSVEDQNQVIDAVLKSI